MTRDGKQHFIKQHFRLFSWYNGNNQPAVKKQQITEGDESIDYNGGVDQDGGAGGVDYDGGDKVLATMAA